MLSKMFARGPHADIPSGKARACRDNRIPAWEDWEKHGHFSHHYPSQSLSASMGAALVLNFRLSQFEKDNINYLTCTDFLKELNDTPYFVIYSSQSFTHLLAANPFCGTKLLNTFGSDSFGFFLDYFYHAPHNRLKDRIDNTWKTWMDTFKCKHTIGMHVRRHGDEEFLTDNGVSLMFKCSQWLSLSYGMNNTCLFLASDSSNTKYMANIAPIKLLSIDDLPKEVDAKTSLGQDATILDWFLLRRCNDFILTAGSSYGVTAAASRRIPPVLVTNVDSGGRRGPFCVRQTVSFPFANALNYLTPDIYILNPTCSNSLLFPISIHDIAIPLQSLPMRVDWGYRIKATVLLVFPIIILFIYYRKKFLLPVKNGRV